MKNIIYITSLLIILVSVFLMIQYPESGRMNLIAGGLFPIGILLNVLVFRMQRQQHKIKTDQLSNE
jgi:uncharacterized membrane protein